MSAPAANSYPYGEAPERKRMTGPMVLVGPRPTFTPLEDLVRDTGPLPVRIPGRALAEEMAGPVPYASPEGNVVTLRRTAAALAPAARGGESIYAAALAEHGRHAAPAEPEPEPVPEPESDDPEPLAAVAVPERLQNFLRVLVGDAALGLSTLIARDGFTSEVCERAGRTARLADELLLADDSDAALRALLAEGWQ